MFPIGRDIEANAGIGTVGYDTKKKKAESDLASAMGTEKENQSIRSNEALEEERRMKDELVPNPAGPDLPMIPRGQLTSPTTAIINQTGAANRTAATNQNRIDVAETNINAKAALQSNAHLTLDQLAAQAVKEGDQATLATIEEYKQKIAKSGATEPGSYIPFNDAQGNVTGWVNPKANKFVGVGAIPGAAASMGPQNPGTPPVMPPKPTAGEQNDLKGAQEDLNYADLYEQSGAFTGAGDEMLMEKYFDLAKPRSGFRMSQPQIEMLLKAKSWMVSAEGAAYHASTGQWFPPQQRNEIIATMRMGAQAKGVGNKPTPNTPAAPAAGELTPAQRFMQNRKKPNG
jgi:hypothetical protein